MKMKFYKLSIILIMVLMTMGCANPNQGSALVEDFYEPKPITATVVEHHYHAQPVSYHRVNRGETLYSIARRYNLDYRSLAAVNRIDSRYEIYPGDQLTLSGVTAKKAWQPAVYRPPVRTSREPIYTNVQPSRPSYPITIASFSGSSINTTPTTPGRTMLGANRDPNAWTWPTSGTLVRNFHGSGSLHKGIDLRGNLGEPVRAAAAGRVVYAGDGLRNYGNMVIVKHSDKFLSAYAHNRRILVTEGVTVAQGQRIAEMGSSGTDSVKLHFEIRYDGNPVDPLQYLPTNR